MSFGKPVFWGVALLCVVVALMSLRFVVLGVDAAFPVLMDNPGASRVAFMTHVVAASLALAIAVPQFLPGLRARRRALHRLAGRAYALALASQRLLAASYWPCTSGAVRCIRRLATTT